MGAAQGETGYLSIYSIVHFVAGWLWHVVWVWTGAGSTWVSAWLVAVLAIVFELAENSRLVSYWIWRKTLGQDGRAYTQDSLENSQCDVLLALLGWLGVELIDDATSGATGARIALLCTGLGLFGLFLLLFWLRLRMDRRRALPTEVMMVAMPSITAATTTTTAAGAGAAAAAAPHGGHKKSVRFQLAL